MTTIPPTHRLGAVEAHTSLEQHHTLLTTLAQNLPHHRPVKLRTTGRLLPDREVRRDSSREVAARLSLQCRHLLRLPYPRLP